MAELKQLNDNPYAYLRRLPIERLLELLDEVRVPADSPEDEAYLDALEEAILEKEAEQPSGILPDVNQQWEQFVTHYLPELEDAALAPEDAGEPQEACRKRVVRFRRVWRKALAAVAAVVCIFAIMLTAQAADTAVFRDSRGNIWNLTLSSSRSGKTAGTSTCFQLERVCDGTVDSWIQAEQVPKVLTSSAAITTFEGGYDTAHCAGTISLAGSSGACHVSYTYLSMVTMVSSTHQFCVVYPEAASVYQGQSFR